MLCRIRLDAPLHTEAHKGQTQIDVKAYANTREWLDQFNASA